MPSLNYNVIMVTRKNIVKEKPRTKRKQNKEVEQRTTKEMKGTLITK